MNTATQPAPMLRFNLWLPLELRKQIEAYSAETGCPMGEVFAAQLRHGFGSNRQRGPVNAAIHGTYSASGEPGD